ncbi:polyribonucleotide nucleotidyltransferase [Patescibacteria group bacterium]|nr:polyribonucleotide nucleotidyltransferase [Patescibacteria group bacterium]MBU1922100.1 polyribonucleotide nucleotidyltransferase [Patescibacteria group bacterium]
MIKKFDVEWAGRKLEIEIGRLAGQADGSCTVRYGDTVVLATAVMAKEPREDCDFLPLSVDYEEKFYAAGKIKGSRFIKREGRPSDDAVLTGRFIDRAIRPLFDHGIRNSIQIITTILSIDKENDPDIVAFIGAATALMISNIPWQGPIAAIRIGQIEGEWVLNPTYEARGKSALDLTVCGSADRICMIEADAKQVKEEVVNEAILFGQKHLKTITKFIESIAKEVGAPKIEFKEKKSDEDGEDGKVSQEDKEKVIQLTKEFIGERVQKAFFDAPKASKVERSQAINELKDQLDEFLKEKQIGKPKRKIGLSLVYEFVEAEVSRVIMEQGKRVDNRQLDEVRELKVEVGLLPRTHGSALFSRGQTQALSVITLGGPSDEQIIDSMELDEKRRFMLHYNFPPYSVGETGRLGSPGRREIGHGALAERALLPVLPEKENFPYTIRAVSEILSSNGSSSMASTCGACLAMMDAGIPIKEPVAGIAMGMASDDKGNFKILTDLQDLEDSNGGMDFKIAGTRHGITAIQMDTKTTGLTNEMIQQTLTQAKEAKMHILDAMQKVIAEPRKELSPFAPRIITLKINPEKIRDVIGPGGKIINEIIDKTGVSIDIEQDGTVLITAVEGAGATRAIDWIKDLTREAEIGTTYDGKVTRLMDFGAFVEILPNKEGMAHISELAPYRVDKVQDVLKVGQEVRVKVIEIDSMGRINLSVKEAEGYVPPANRPPQSSDRSSSGRSSSGPFQRRGRPAFKRGR